MSFFSNSYPTHLTLSTAVVVFSPRYLDTCWVDDVVKKISRIKQLKMSWLRCTYKYFFFLNQFLAWDSPFLIPSFCHEESKQYQEEEGLSRAADYERPSHLRSLPGSSTFTFCAKVWSLDAILWGPFSTFFISCVKPCAAIILHACSIV